jgi:hypothetical protein
MSKKALKVVGRLSQIKLKLKRVTRHHLSVQQEPLLLGFLTDDEKLIMAWCPFCACFHNHGLPSEHNLDEMIHYRRAHCANENSPFIGSEYAIILIRGVTLPRDFKFLCGAHPSLVQIYKEIDAQNSVSRLMASCKACRKR